MNGPGVGALCASYELLSLSHTLFLSRSERSCQRAKRMRAPNHVTYIQWLCLTLVVPFNDHWGQDHLQHHPLHSLNEHLPPSSTFYAMSSAEQYVRTEHPVIDSDPHFTRVVRYMRGSDLVAWGGLTAAGPATLLAFGRNPNRLPFLLVCFNDQQEKATTKRGDRSPA
jgi:hypothetical protein